jgi:L-lactate dehydrogenase complex protein LldG
MPDSQELVLSRVRRALGRTQLLSAPPVPPAIDEPITRLVHSDIGLAELFKKTADANKIQVIALRVEELAERLIETLKAEQLHRVALPVSPLLDRLDLPGTLCRAGFDARRWDAMTLDELYDFDCSVTDVYAAVAETGSLVVRASIGHGRALSLVPAVHLAVVEPKNLLPDLVDLFEKLVVEGIGSGVTLISGPSKTSDLEMQLETGGQGPCKVIAFVLE